MTGYIGGMIAGILILVIRKWQKKPWINQAGWKTLYASWLEDLMILIAGILSSVSGYVLVHGSARPDAERQEVIALILFAGAVCGLLFFLWLSYIQKVEWKGGKVRTQTIRFLTRPKIRRFSDMVSASGDETSADHRIEFRDGSKLWISGISHGSNDFFARIPKKAKRGD